MSVLLMASGAIAAEAHIQTEILDMMFGKQMNVDPVTQCVERITNQFMEEKRLSAFQQLTIN